MSLQGTLLVEGEDGSDGAYVEVPPQLGVLAVQQVAPATARRQNPPHTPSFRRTLAKPAYLISSLADGTARGHPRRVFENLGRRVTRIGSRSSSVLALQGSRSTAQRQSVRRARARPARPSGGTQPAIRPAQRSRGSQRRPQASRRSARRFFANSVCVTREGRWMLDGRQVRGTASRAVAGQGC